MLFQPDAQTNLCDKASLSAVWAKSQDKWMAEGGDFVQTKPSVEESTEDYQQ